MDYNLKKNAVSGTMIFVLEKEVLGCYNPFHKNSYCIGKYEMAEKPLKS